MSKVDLGISDDYAVLDSGSYRFYYGYEMTDENDRWQFGVRKGDRLLLRTTPDLPEDLEGADPIEILTYCIGVFIYKQQK